MDEDETYLCRFLNTNTLELVGRGSWRMSVGWAPPVVSAVEECGHMTGHIALSYMWMCVRWLVTLPVTGTYVFDYCAMKLLRPWELLKLSWSECESAAEVKYCCYEFHLCCSCQVYLDLCDQLGVQEILPVLFLRLTVADPFKTKQESQGALEISDEPPCYILQCSLLVLI